MELDNKGSQGKAFFCGSWILFGLVFLVGVKSRPLLHKCIWFFDPLTACISIKGYHTCHPQTPEQPCEWSSLEQCQIPSLAWASLLGFSLLCVSGNIWKYNITLKSSFWLSNRTHEYNNKVYFWTVIEMWKGLEKVHLYSSINAGFIFFSFSITIS